MALRLIICTIALLAILTPLHSLASTLTCQKDIKHQVAAIKGSSGTPLFLNDLSFEQSPFVPEALYCEHWLETSLPTAAQREVTQFKPTLKWFGPAFARIVGQDRTRIYEACAKSELCKIRFPYFLFNFQAFKRFWMDSFGLTRKLHQTTESEKLCQTRAPLEFKRAEWKGEIPELVITPNDQWKLAPLWTLSDQVFEILKRNQPVKILISSMTISKTQVNRLKEELREKPQSQVILMFDVLASDARSEFLSHIADAPSNLIFFPVFNTPTTPKFYHLKGLVSNQDDLVLGTSNFTNRNSQVTMDLALYSKDPLKAQLLRNTFLGFARNLCGQKEFLACSLETMATPDQPLSAAIQLAQAQGCEAIQGFPQAIQATDSLIRTDQWDLVPYLVSKIAQAKSSIIAFTHHLDHPEIIEALNQAAKRGVQVQTIVGAGQDLPPQAPGRHQSFLRAFLEPHSKGLMIDHHEVIGCSGNLTTNGLEESVEICWRLADPAAIQAYDRYLASTGDFLKDTEFRQWLTSDLQRHLPPLSTPVVYFPFGKSRESPAWFYSYPHLKPVSGMEGDFLEPTGVVRKCLEKLSPAFLYSHFSVKECLISEGLIPPSDNWDPKKEGRPLVRSKDPVTPLSAPSK